MTFVRIRFVSNWEREIALLTPFGLLSGSTPRCLDIRYMCETCTSDKFVAQILSHCPALQSMTISAVSPWGGLVMST